MVAANHSFSHLSYTHTHTHISHSPTYYTTYTIKVELREYIKMGCGLYSCTVGKDHSVNFDHCRSISGQAQVSTHTVTLAYLMHIAPITSYSLSLPLISLPLPLPLISLPLSPSMSSLKRSSDPDQLCSLVLEIIPHSSCLVFCPTKRNCQNVALLLSSSLPR